MIIIGLAALKYFLNWDIFDAAESDQGKSTILYIRDLFNTLWSYIGAPLTFVWSEIFWPILYVAWQNFQAFIDWARMTAQASPQ